LANSLDEEHVRYVFYESSNTLIPSECENTEHPGAASAENPEADPGFLCVYGVRASLLNKAEMPILTAVGTVGAETSGAFLYQEAKPLPVGSPEERLGQGTWAVTAP
jgi:hypothetical protein